MPSLRLAWGRVDYAATDHTTISALFGQDWTPFGSSTLPSLLETTGLGLAFGSLYERAPQARFGFTYNFGGSRSVKFQPEVAVVLPVFGVGPGNALTVSVSSAAGTCTTAAPCTGTVAGAAGVIGGVGIDQQLGFGERQGVDSARPEVQGRLALQFQLDKAPGVAPAQLIVSGMQGERQATVLAAAVPAAFRSAFPTGVQVNSSRAGYSGEIQLPTRYATLIAKYWNGEDLRFYFSGQFGSIFNDTALLVCRVAFTPPARCPAGQAGSVTGFSADASTSVAFGFDATGTAQVAPQRPVRAAGGFINLGLPLSRIFNANPDGRNAGWSLYLHYGIDQAKTRDIVRGGLTPLVRTNKGDLSAATIYYKLNSWVTFGVEGSLYRTRMPSGKFFTFRGIPSREAHDIRAEFGTIFTF
jgi:hypothetical protein